MKNHVCSLGFCDTLISKLSQLSGTIKQVFGLLG
uniref:Uncharacterized protein n=1 Tax=Rhizophora mucronata TaxID=61149 RepID=A0A2P2Q4M8_RHIMU